MAAAQDAEGLVEIPLDKSAPEMVELEQAMQSATFRSLGERFTTGPLASRVKSAELEKDRVLVDLARELGRSPLALLLSVQGLKARSNGTEDTFFAVIDLPQVVQLAKSKSEVAGMQAIAGQREAVDQNFLSVRDNTTFSPPGEGWFTTRYSDVPANLRCDWVYNPRLVQHDDLSDAKQQEQELENAFRADAIERDQPGTSDEVSAEHEAQAADASDDEMEEGDTGIERQFEIAGRPCLLTYQCDDAQFPCSDAIADELAENVVLVTPGEQ